MSNRLLHVSGSPHIHGGESTRKIMWSVVIALIPALVVSVFYFGLPPLIITAVSVLSCVLFEHLTCKLFLKTKSTISDGSAVITGMLLAFNLPANLPLGWVILGAFVAIVIAKMAFGGLGKNLFNPALVGRAFLLISRPVEMTSWPTPEPIWGFAQAMTGPTPLGIMKDGLKAGQTPEQILRTTDGIPDYVQMLMGQMGGSFGEISALALLIGALFLIIRKVITWHIPMSFLLSALAMASILYFCNHDLYVIPWFHLVTGGMILGACFMATDMVTSPVSPMGMIVFGIGCGVLTIIIRVFGAYPEGVSFAILLMNAVTPLIDRAFKPKMFGK